jgi:nitroimidazol reductase NimA-like FMN-containing flavoprotein (pyridoxamine 5'-phosphate oxidase superfamily)
MPVTVPRFEDLSVDECRDVLARNHVGRLAFLRTGAVDIQPVAFVLRNNWIVMRSAYGTKIAALEESPYVAFEVDEVRGPFDWVSVVVRGTIYEKSPRAGPVERAEWERSVDALRAVNPAVFSDQDPTPERDIVYGLNIHEITGRRASAADEPAPTPAEQPPRPPRRSDGY